MGMVNQHLHGLAMACSTQRSLVGAANQRIEATDKPARPTVELAMLMPGVL